jgi:hypothetical protein
MTTLAENFQSQESFAIPEQLWDAFQGSIHSQDGRFANETWEIKKLKPQPKEESSLLDTQWGHTLVEVGKECCSNDARKCDGDNE